MKTQGKSSSTAPFSIKTETKDMKKSYTLYVPKNIESLLDVFPVLILMKCARSLDWKFETTDKEFTVNETTETRSFFLGYSTELFATEAPTSLTLKKSTDSNKGTTSARLLKLRTALRDERLTDISFLLPDSIYADPVKRIEHLTVYLNRGLLTEGENNLTFVSSFKSIVSKYAEAYARDISIPAYLDIKIHVSEVVKGLHRRVKRKVRGKEILVTITPNRPSRRVEILTSEEQQLIEGCEGVFTAYENKISNLTKNYVKIRDVLTVRAELSTLINKQWELVRKISPVLSPRSKILSELIKKELKKNDLTKQNISEVMSRLASDPSDYDLKVFRSLNIIEVANRVCSINNEKVSTYGFFEFKGGKLAFSQLTTTASTVKAVLSILHLLGIETHGDAEKLSFTLLPRELEGESKKDRRNSRKKKGAKVSATTSPDENPVEEE